MQKTIHALLIGINKYAPLSNVKPLSGCVNDISAMAQFLRKQYHDNELKITSLSDEYATKEKILDTFHSHLCNTNKVKKGDIVLFYFSGHGSQARTPSEFAAFDSTRIDETLVCYDSRLPGLQDIADKEIAVLLSRIRQDAEIVVIIDACHAGSITRNGLGNQMHSTENQKEFRSIPAARLSRHHTLENYFFTQDKYYSHPPFLKASEFHIPTANYIALMACSRNELAWENYGRGAFSFELLSQLNNHHGQVSYAKLFQSIQAKLTQRRNRQTPQIVVNGNFDIRKLFLSDDLAFPSPSYTVSYHNGSWSMNHGILYGMKKSTEPIQINLFTKSDIGKSYLPFKKVLVYKIAQQECILDFKHSDRKQIFRAEIAQKEHAHFIYVDPSHIKIKEILDRNNQYKFQFTTKKEKGKYQLVISESAYKIFDLHSHAFVHGCSRILPKSIEYIYVILSQLIQYETLSALNNPDTLIDRTKIKFHFLSDSEHSIETSPLTSVNQLNYEQLPFPYRIEAINQSPEDYFIALVHFTQKYGVEVHYPCTKFIGASNAKSATPIILDNQRQLNIHIPESNRSGTTIDTFKIIVSNRPFQNYKFSLPDIAPILVQETVNLRAYDKKTNLPFAEEDWFTKTIRIEIGSAPQWAIAAPSKI